MKPRLCDIYESAAIMGYGVRHTRRLLAGIEPLRFERKKRGRKWIFKWVRSDVEKLKAGLK